MVQVSKKGGGKNRGGEERDSEGVRKRGRERGGWREGTKPVRASGEKKEFMLRNIWWV